MAVHRYRCRSSDEDGGGPFTLLAMDGYNGDFPASFLNCLSTRIRTSVPLMISVRIALLDCIYA